MTFVSFDGPVEASVSEKPDRLLLLLAHYSVDVSLQDDVDAAVDVQLAPDVQLVAVGYSPAVASVVVAAAAFGSWPAAAAFVDDPVVVDPVAVDAAEVGSSAAVVAAEVGCPVSGADSADVPNFAPELFCSACFCSDSLL